jgi:hypothetical protein
LTLLLLGLISKTFGQCLEDEAGIIWTSDESIISFYDLARYAAPMLWFSPDEIKLFAKDGKKQLPELFPFERDDERQPVVYYKIRHIYGTDPVLALINQPTDEAELESVNKDLQLLDLKYVRAIDLDFYYYFQYETGPTAHEHDIESVALQLRVFDAVACPDFQYAIKVNRVTGRAHGLHWYNNVLKVDPQTSFPLSIIIEEGKHASCTDKNADGIYTPTYDVTEKVNDAWGVRDIITSGRLVSGGWQSWMAKRRDGNSIVFPPLPMDSPWYTKFVKRFGEDHEGSSYQLRPYPDYRRMKALGKIEPGLDRFMGDKTPHIWPKFNRVSGSGRITQWIKEEKSYRSLSLAYRWDDTQRLSFAFPLLFFKNVEAPKTGGWIYNKFYIGDFDALDTQTPVGFDKLLGHQITYSSSASRWVDMYVGAGYEIYDADLTMNGTQYETFLVSEIGVKFRLNITRTPLRFLRHLGTDFWGIKAGWKNVGFSPFLTSGFVIELGAGVF